jgi:hypothetical protein
MFLILDPTVFGRLQARNADKYVLLPIYSLALIAC